jgi:hypothetical protein
VCAVDMLGVQWVCWMYSGYILCVVVLLDL